MWTAGPIKKSFTQTYKPFTIRDMNKSNSINRVELQGRAGTVRISPAIGSIAANFSLMTESPVISVEGKKLVETTWHNVLAVEGGEVCLEGITRGSLVHLTGRLRTVRYTASDGTERTFTEVVAESLKVLER